jgi:spore coat polysaccharide biosynthesis protein SpsF
MKTAIFITVRIDSSRLPSKAMIKILGRPVLELIILRARQAKLFDEIVVCTTKREVDDKIEKLSLKNNVKVYRGSLKDKLNRWYNAAKKYKIDNIVTFDGDDLFCDPDLLDLGAKQILNGNIDFIEAPIGLVCGGFTYAFTFNALKKVCSIKDTEDTEMMWTYFKDTGLFKCGVLKNVKKIYYSDKIRLTLDYPEDLEFFKVVFEYFNCKNNDIPLPEILHYLIQNPNISKINYKRQKDFLENQKKKTKLVLKSTQNIINKGV